MCNLGYGYPCCGFEIKRNSDKCKGCVHFDYYRDMGASTPICTLERDLDKAIQKANEVECNEKITMQQALDKAKAFDRLVEVGFIKLLDKPTIMIRNGINEVVMTISDKDYEILEKAMEVKDNE